MYKVFLVDDEIVVREGIRSNFPWDETFELAGEAPDGEIALTMLQDVKPDILITDIRMPFMDGLELCRQVSRTMPWVYIIILSGYDDFAYAKEAISLGVSEYLLKPVSGEELRGVLERISLRIEDDKRRRASDREQMAASNRFQREKLLTELYRGGNCERIIKEARSMKINLLANHYLVMLLSPEAEQENEEKLLTAQGVAERLAENSGGAAHHLRSFYNGRTEFIFLVMGDTPEDLEERAYGLAQSACFDAQRSAGIELLVAIGEEENSLKDISKSLGNTRGIMEKLRDGKVKNRAMRIMGAQEVPPEPELSLPDMDSAPLADQLRYAAAEDVDAVLNKYVAGLGDSAAQSVMMANYFFVEIMLAASRIVRDSGGNPKEIIPEAFRTQNSMLSVDEALPLCRNMLRRAVEFRESRGSERYGSVIRKARAFINERYADSNLTLHDVASHVALSNNHFCTVFSQEVGQTFTEYLTAVRIGRAKELLSATSMRTSDVAYSVGYNDPHYFSYLFKKNTGISPRDYRKDEKNGK